MKFYLTPHPTFFPVCGCPDKSLCGPGTRLFMIGYKKPATVVQEGKGDRGEEEVRASEGPSPEDLVVMEIVRGGV
jgi:hypothetical protein